MPDDIIIDVSNENIFQAHNIEPGEYSLGLYAQYLVDGFICTRRKTIPFIIPYKAGLKYEATCENNGLYTVNLLDHSIFYPGTPITSYEFSTNGGTNWFSSVMIGDIHGYTAHLAPGIYTLKIRIKRQAGVENYPPCETTVILDLPAYPNADFTYDIACPGEATAFHVTQSHAGETYQWTFPDASVILQEEAVKTFSGEETFGATLLVSNQYGCSTIFSSAVIVQQQTLDGEINSSPAENCNGETISLTFNSLGQNNPDHIDWYQNQLTDTAFAVTPFGTPLSVGESASYFAIAVGADGCKYYDAPPKSVMFIPTPETPQIRGTSIICFGDTANITVPDNDDVHYLWWLDGIAQPVWDNFRILNHYLTSPGVHIFTAVAEVVSSSGNHCQSPPANFYVTVGLPPADPAIAFTVNSCVPYKVTAVVSNPQTGVSYFWSNGATGTVAIITHDGPLQVRAELDGCAVTSQIDLPLDLTRLGWIFPKGCYFMCKDEPSGYMIGPLGAYAHWAWIEDSTADTMGSGAIAPYTGFDGTSHEYSLLVQTPYCDAFFETMSMTVGDMCADCKLKMDKKEISLKKDKDNCWYTIVLSFDNPGVGMWVTLTAPNGEGYFTPGTVFIPGGISYQSFDFYPVNGFIGGGLSILFESELSGRKCIDNLEIELPPLCSTGRYKNPETKVEDKLLVAPNPAKESTVIYYEISEDLDHTVLEVRDLLGRPLYEFQPKDTVGEELLDCSRYAEGTYLIFMRVNGHIVKKVKFIVRKM